MSPDKALGVRDCICADPENCTQPVPGRRCRKGGAGWWSDAEKREIADRYLSMLAGECRNIGDVWALKQRLDALARAEIARLERSK